LLTRTESTEVEYAVPLKAKVEDNEMEYGAVEDE
jgi:hypothetical protein